MSLDTFWAPGGLTVAGLLIAILIAGSRGVWYYGNVLRDVMKDRDDWKGIATASTSTVRQQADQIAALTDISESLAETLKQRHA